MKTQVFVAQLIIQVQDHTQAGFTLQLLLSPGLLCDARWGGMNQCGLGWMPS